MGEIEASICTDNNGIDAFLLGAYASADVCVAKWLSDNARAMCAR